MPEATVVQLGEIPLTCFNAGERGRVLAAFPRAAYLLTERGQLFWMSSFDAPMHRRCIALSGPFPRLAVEAGFCFDNHALWVDSLGQFDLLGAARWHEKPLRHEWALPLPELLDRVRNFLATIQIASAAGFGVLLPSILSLLDGRSAAAPTSYDDPVLTVASPLVLGMANACVVQDHSAMIGIAPQLVGFGHGLTPSGDDFVGGLLFAMRGLDATYPNAWASPCLLRPEQYMDKTNGISATLLRDLADGHAIAPLQALLDGLLTGQTPDCTYRSFIEVTRVGHSTGWDLLTGLLTGLLAVLGRVELPSRSSLAQRVVF